MTLEEFNALDIQSARTHLHNCCGSSRWVEGMLKERPFSSSDVVLESADTVWWRLSTSDWQEAFAQHPKIGDRESLRQKFASTAHWASGEQAGVASASEETLARLEQGNRLYEEKFGFIFIVCATGKSAAEMCDMLYHRLDNQPDEEIRVAASEQALITRLRLQKLVH